MNSGAAHTEEAPAMAKNVPAIFIQCLRTFINPPEGFAYFQNNIFL
jgi:hypothetical protein